MTAKDYCSKVCGAKCCKAHAPIIWPPQCPKLTPDNLCSIYEQRIGYTFDARADDGGSGRCVCSRPETFVKTLPAEIRAECCFAHPELLEQPLEVVPSGVTKRAEAMEQGKTIIGGRQYGKTWAARIASARPLNKPLSDTTP